MGKWKKQRRGGQKPLLPAPRPNRVPWIVGGAIAIAAAVGFAVFRPPSTPAPAPAASAPKVEEGSVVRSGHSTQAQRVKDRLRAD